MAVVDEELAMVGAGAPAASQKNERESARYPSVGRSILHSAPWSAARAARVLVLVENRAANRFVTSGAR